MSTLVAALLAAAVAVAIAAAERRSADAPRASANLVSNTSFESGLSGWRVYGGRLARVRARSAPAGEYVARLTYGSPAGLVLDDHGPVMRKASPGQTLRASAMVRAATRGAVGARASIRIVQGSKVAVGRPVRLGRGFARIAAAHRTRGREPVQLRIRLDGARAGDAFDIDSVSLAGGRAAAGRPPELRGDAEAFPYDPSAAFNQAIPAGVPSDPRSDAIVRQLDENSSIVPFSLASRLNTPPIHVAQPGDPFYRVTVGSLDTRFRVPPDVAAGGGSDYPLVIMDPLHPEHGRATELRLWQATIGDGQIDAAGKGLFHYNNDGARLNPDGSPSTGVPFAGAGVGGGLSITAGLIRAEDFTAGEIRHALRFAYSAPDFVNGVRSPATKSDQGSQPRDPSTAMVMGMRLQLDPAVNCEARTVPTESSPGRQTQLLRMICRALQRYGMIVMDGTADRKVVMMMEHSDTAGWPAILGPERQQSYSWLIRDASSAGDGLSRTASSGIPWDRLRVLARSTF
jgi:hypothetical protein